MAFREAERSSFTRAGMERARDRAAAWLCTLPRIAIKPKIQERSRVMIWLGSKFCAHQDRRRERDGGATVPRPVRIRSIRSEMARTSEARACI